MISLQSSLCYIYSCWIFWHNPFCGFNMEYNVQRYEQKRRRKRQKDEKEEEG
jgi:hypothetical protein